MINAAVLVSILSSAIFYYWCIIPYYEILGKNKCSMTYTNKAISDRRELVKLNVNTSYILWKYKNANSKGEVSIPVLFIPGHLGRYVIIHDM